MNISLLIVASTTSIAFLAHTVVGIKEAYSTEPKTLQATVDTTIQRNWMQSMAAFQMVTVDLLLLSVLLWLLALTNWIPQAEGVTMVLSGLFLLWGLAWWLQVVFISENKKDYLALSQWLLWLLNAALLYWGA